MINAEVQYDAFSWVCTFQKVAIFPNWGGLCTKALRGNFKS